MVSKLPEKVSPQVPKKISPSQIGIARDCTLRFILNNHVPEEMMPLPSAAPQRYSGSLFHTVIEAARVGKSGNPPAISELEIIWSKGLDDIEEKMKRNGDGCWLPLSTTVPNIERIRLRAIKLAGAQSVYTGQASGGKSTTEFWVTNKQGNVGGYIDSINYEKGLVVLTDYKSGKVLADKGQIKPSYVSQLLLYAVLFEEHRGIWPDTLEIIDHRGKKYEVPLDKSEALQELETAVDTLNEIQSEFSTDGDIEEAKLSGMANPSHECRFCRHRPRCPEYLRNFQDNEIMSFDGRLDLVGTLIELGLRDNYYWIKLNCGNKVKVVEDIPIAGKPIPSIPSGTKIVVFNCYPKRRVDSILDCQQFIARRDSVAFVLD